MGPVKVKYLEHEIIISVMNIYSAFPLQAVPFIRKVRILILEK
jgi:hypothetical protein